MLRQPGGIAFDIFDARIAGIARQFQDFRDAEKAGALVTADSIDALAQRMAVPADALRAEFAIAFGKPDRFGRVIEKPLAAPYCAIRVTGALFHTQGGLAIDPRTRVLQNNGTAVPQPVRRRWRGGRRVGFAGLRLSVGKRAAHRDGVRPYRRNLGGETVTGNRVVSPRSDDDIEWNRRSL